MNFQSFLDGISGIIGNHFWHYLDIYIVGQDDKEHILTYTVPDHLIEPISQYIKNLVETVQDIKITMIILRKFQNQVWNSVALYDIKLEENKKALRDQKTATGEWIV